MRPDATGAAVAGAAGAVAAGLWLGCHLPPGALLLPLLVVGLATAWVATRHPRRERAERVVVSGYRSLYRAGVLLHLPTPAASVLCPLPLTEDERAVALVGAYANWRAGFHAWLALPEEERVRTPMPHPPSGIFR